MLHSYPNQPQLVRKGGSGSMHTDPVQQASTTNMHELLQAWCCWIAWLGVHSRWHSLIYLFNSCLTCHIGPNGTPNSYMQEKTRNRWDFVCLVLEKYNPLIQALEEYGWQVSPLIVILQTIEGGVYTYICITCKDHEILKPPTRSIKFCLTSLPESHLSNLSQHLW